MLLDGPAVLGDPSRWPGQTACLRTTTETIQGLVEAGTVRPVDAEAAARLINGAVPQNDEGLCRFNPPVNQPGPDAHGLWPVVGSTDWCGHYTPEMTAAE